MSHGTKGLLIAGFAICLYTFSNWQGHGQETGPKRLPPRPGETAKPATGADGAARVAEFGDPAMNGLKGSQGSTLLKGGSFQVRGADEATFSATTKRVPYEVYRDDDFQTQVVVSESGSVSALPYRKVFQLRVLGLGAGGYEAVRFSSATGASWRLKNERWQAVTEPAGSNMPFPSEYDVQVTDVGGAAVVMRLDVRSGASWILNEDAWQAVPE